jgi:hypothetical protein
MPTILIFETVLDKYMYIVAIRRCKLIPEQICTGPEQICTIPEQICTGPEQICTIPEQICTIPEQICTIPEVCSWLRLPEFLDNRDMKVVTCQPITPAAFTPREYS